MFDRIQVRISKVCSKPHEWQLSILTVELVSLNSDFNITSSVKELANKSVRSFMNFTTNINKLWSLIFWQCFFKINILFYNFLFWNWKWKFINNIFQNFCIHYECRKLRYRKDLFRTLSNIYDGEFLDGAFSCLHFGRVFVVVVVLKTINRCEKPVSNENSNIT